MPPIRAQALARMVSCCVHSITRAFEFSARAADKEWDRLAVLFDHETDIMLEPVMAKFGELLSGHAVFREVFRLM
jgi:hypothetical protein